MLLKRMLIYFGLMLLPSVASAAAPRGVLDDPGRMAIFFRDKEMRKIVLLEDFRAFFMGSPFELQDEIKSACREVAIRNHHAELCSYVTKLTQPE